MAEGNPNYVPNIVEYPTTNQYYGQETFYPWISETSKAAARQVYKYKLPINALFALGTAAYVTSQARKDYLETKKRIEREQQEELEKFKRRNMKRITSSSRVPGTPAAPEEREAQKQLIELEPKITRPQYKVKVPKEGIRRQRGVQQFDAIREDAAEYIAASIKNYGLIDTINNLSKQEQYKNSLHMRQLLTMLTSDDEMQRAINQGEYIPAAFRRFIPEDVAGAMKEHKKWVPKPEYAEIKKYWKQRYPDLK